MPPRDDVRLTNGEVTYLHKDYLGSVHMITGADGTRDVMNSYTPFGVVEVSNYDPVQTTETKGFIGERFDEDAGLQYLNARYYDPALGIFIQPDWWEVTTQGVGTNRYSYSFNDPINRKDPFGNEAEKEGGFWEWVDSWFRGPGNEDVIEFDETGHYHFTDEMGTKHILYAPWYDQSNPQAGAMLSDPNLKELIERVSYRRVMEIIRYGKPITSGILRAGGHLSIAPWANKRPAESLAICTSACGEAIVETWGFEEAAVGTIAFSDSRIIPTGGKIGGLQQGTSPASKVSRGLLGHIKLPQSLPTPTSSNPNARTGNLGSYVGRQGPKLVRNVFVFHEAGRLLACSNRCMTDFKE